MSEESQDVVYEASNDHTDESEDSYGVSLLASTPVIVERPQPGHSGGTAN